jgi:hypothetical protein
VPPNWEENGLIIGVVKDDLVSYDQLPSTSVMGSTRNEGEGRSMMICPPSGEDCQVATKPTATKMDTRREIIWKTKKTKEINKTLYTKNYS